MTTTESAAEHARLRLELEHRDQLLASVYARADTLQAVVERLERQLDSAIEAQREAATERAELRRLLGNAQLQVHALMQLPAPETEANGTPERAPESVATAVRLPERPETFGAERVAATPPRKVDEKPPARARRQPELRGLVDEARGVLSNLRRLI